MQGSERGLISELRAQLAYAIHPDTNLLWARGEDTDFEDVVEQSRQMDFAVKEAEEVAMVEFSGESHSVVRVGREWDRLKQQMGVDPDDE